MNNNNIDNNGSQGAWKSLAPVSNSFNIATITYGYIDWSRSILNRSAQSICDVVPHVWYSLLLCMSNNKNDNSLLFKSTFSSFHFWFRKGSDYVRPAISKYINCLRTLVYSTCLTYIVLVTNRIYSWSGSNEPKATCCEALILINDYLNNLLELIP